MEIVKTATKNLLHLGIAEIITKIIGFFYIVILARYLPIAQYGILMFAISFTEICSIGLDLGLSMILTREVAKDETQKKKYVDNIIVIKILLSLFVFIIVAMLLYSGKYTQTETAVIILIFGMSVVNSYIIVFQAVFQAVNKMQYVAIGKILISSILFFGTLVVMRAQGGVILFSVFYLFAALIVLLISTLIYRLKFKTTIRFETDWKFWKNTVKFATPFAVSVIFVTLYYRINSVMLRFYFGNEAVGFYSAAFNFIMALTFIQATLISAIFPIMSRLYIESRDKLKILYENSFKLLALLAFPIGVGTTLLAPQIINLVYGEKFAASIVLLKILVWALVFMFLNISIANLLNVINQQRLVALQIIIAAIFNISINLYAIPRFGLVGAGISTVISEIFVFLLLLIFVSKFNYHFSRKTVFDFFKIIFCSVLMGVIIFYFYNFNLFIIIAISGALYGCFIFMLRIIDQFTIKLLYKLILNK